MTDALGDRSVRIPGTLAILIESDALIRQAETAVCKSTVTLMSRRR